MPKTPLKPNQAICPNCGITETHSFVVNRAWTAPLCKSCFRTLKSDKSSKYNYKSSEEEPKTHTVKNSEHKFGGHTWGTPSEELARKIYEQNK